MSEIDSEHFMPLWILDDILKSVGRFVNNETGEEHEIRTIVALLDYIAHDLHSHSKLPVEANVIFQFITEHLT